MSLDDRHEIEQLDALAAELAEAGEIARAASARSEIPDAFFAVRLRAQLLGGLPRPGPAPTAAVPPKALPVPPDRPLGVPQSLDDRRGLHAAAAGRRARTLESAREPFSAAISTNRDGEQATALEAGKRWRARQVQPITATRPGVLAAAELADLGAVPSEHVATLHPSVRWRMPTRILPPRWVAVGLAAAIAIASFLYGTTQLFPVRPDATVDVAAATTLVRAGTASPLVQGTQLLEGDEIKVGAGGQATLAMSGSFVRLAPGCDVRLDSLGSNHIVVALLAGRAYHRASALGDYTVVTGSVSWVATGTAFDLDRHPSAAGGDEVRGLILLDGLELQGPQLAASLNQGQSATVELAAGGSRLGEPVIGQIGAQVLADSWLVENAHLDALAGLNLGDLAADVSPTPRPSGTPGQTAAPVTRPTAAPTGGPIRQATPSPTRKASPRPTPARPASLGKLTIVDDGDGSYTFSWPKYNGNGFTSYKLLYGDWGTTPSYPASPFWACNDSADDNSWTGPVDVGNYAVRVQAVDESSGVVIRAQTGVVHLKVAAPAPTPPPTEDLGALGFSDDGGGKYTFSWAAYTGGWCFDAYKLVYVAGNGDPSYLNGDSYKAFGTGATSGSLDLTSGDWSVRVQAIGRPNGGDAYVFAQSSVYHLTVP